MTSRRRLVFGRAPLCRSGYSRSVIALLGAWAAAVSLAMAFPGQLPELPPAIWCGSALLAPALAIAVCRKLTAWSAAAEAALRKMRDDAHPTELPDCPDPLFSRLYDACLDLGGTQQSRRVAAGLEERASPAALAALQQGSLHWSNGWTRCALPLIVAEPVDAAAAAADIDRLRLSIGRQLGALRAGGAILDGHRWGEIVALVPPGDEAAARACAAALACSAESAGVSMAIGVSLLQVGMGELVEGGLTVFGSETEHARLLVKAARLLGTSVLADDGIRKAAGAGFRGRRLGRFRFGWRKLEVHAIEATEPGTAESIEFYAAGLALLEARDWAGAGERFKACLKLLPSDGPARVCLNFAQRFRNNPPPRSWDGTLVLGGEA